ncbi:hypothetical protein P9112_003186 [Eukaryota sp. TZLM1-RC]
MTSCPICLSESFALPYSTTCGHIFCWPCINQWCRNSQSQGQCSCPVCNNVVKLSDCIRIHGVKEREYKPEEDVPTPPKNEYVASEPARARPARPQFRVVHHGVFPFSFTVSNGHHGMHNPFFPAEYVVPDGPHHSPRIRHPNPAQARKQMLVFFLVLFIFAFFLQISEIVFL